MRLALCLMAIFPVACSNSPLETPTTSTDTNTDTNTGTNTGTDTGTNTGTNTTPTAVHFIVHSMPTNGPGVLVEVDQTDADQTYIKHLAVSDNYLYMLTGHGVYRMPKLGGTVTVVDEDTQSIFRYLASNQQYVFWDKKGIDAQGSLPTQIRRQANANGLITTVLEGAFGFLDTNVPPPYLQATNNDVFLGYNQNGSSIQNEVRIPVSGGPVSAPVFSWNFGEGAPPNWLVDDQGLFMTTGSNPEVGCHLWTFEGPEFARRELAPCPDYKSQLAAIDSESLYLTSGHSLWKMPRAGGPAVDLAMGAPSGYVGWNVLVDQTNVYFDLQSGLVWVPKSGGAVNQLVAASELPGDEIVYMVQDAQYLYVLGGYQHVVVVPKP